MKLDTRDLLSFDELGREETEQLIELAMRVKKNPDSYRTGLDGRTLAMIFEKPSTRTRVSFEAGMYQLGGHALNLSPNDMQLSRGETIPDTARTLSGYVDAVMARVFDHGRLELLAEHSGVPVINGLSDSFHPCQTLADLMTIRERKGRLAGLKLCWIGDGNNVCNSTLYGCAKAGIDVSVATPEGYGPLPEVVRESRRSVCVELSDDPAESVRDSDVVMTDTFSSIHNKDPGRAEKFLPWFRVDDSLMELARPDAIFMHCLPAKRGQEVAASVIDGPQSVVWDEAENRLHSQKALLLSVMS